MKLKIKYNPVVCALKNYNLNFKNPISDREIEPRTLDKVALTLTVSQAAGLITFLSHNLELNISLSSLELLNLFNFIGRSIYSNSSTEVK